MQSLFILLTLENFPNYFLEAMEITPLALVYFLSYVFVIVFTVLNILIGIVLNAMDQAREEEDAKTKALALISALEADLAGVAPEESAVEDEILRIKREIDGLRHRVSKKK